jgi:hypothetical protein
MGLNLSRGDQSMASNQRISANSSQGEPKENETMHQLDEEMEVVNRNFEPISIDLQEASSCYVFFSRL